MPPHSILVSVNKIFQHMFFKKNSEIKKHFSRDEINVICLRRISNLFGINEIDIKGDMIFGVDALNGKQNNTTDNPFEEINFDIELVADNETYKKIKRGEIKINSINDFLNYMYAQYLRDQSGFCSAMIDPYEKRNTSD